MAARPTRLEVHLKIGPRLNPLIFAAILALCPLGASITGCAADQAPGSVDTVENMQLGVQDVRGGLELTAAGVSAFGAGDPTGGRQLMDQGAAMMSGAMTRMRVGMDGMAESGHMSCCDMQMQDAAAALSMMSDAEAQMSAARAMIDDADAANDSAASSDMTSGIASMQSGADHMDAAMGSECARMMNGG